MGFGSLRFGEAAIAVAESSVVVVVVVRGVVVPIAVARRRIRQEESSLSAKSCAAPLDGSYVCIFPFFQYVLRCPELFS